MCTDMEGRGGGAGAGAPYSPRTVDEVFRDFKGRRAGMIKALSTGLSLSLFYSSLFYFIFEFFMVISFDFVAFI